MFLCHVSEDRGNKSLELSTSQVSRVVFSALELQEFNCVPSISGVIEGQGAKSPFLPAALQIRGNWLGCLERERPENQGCSELLAASLMTYSYLFHIF